MTKSNSKLDPWASYLGPNLGYVQEQYERFISNPESVESAFRTLFSTFGEPPAESNTISKINSEEAGDSTIDLGLLKNVVAASKLVWNIRTYGHLAANTDPLNLRKKSDTRNLDPATFKLNKTNLSAFPASLIWGNAPKDVMTGWDAIQKLLEIYALSYSYEFSHVHDEEEREWLNRYVESAASSSLLSTDERKLLLKRMLQVEQFEHFLHRTFVGQKRFSIEGVDTLVPMLDEIVNRLIHEGARDVLMGMA